MKIILKEKLPYHHLINKNKILLWLKIKAKNLINYFLHLGEVIKPEPIIISMLFYL
jgi:hypothetical protein